jgi:light-independent protochlorophyllide reductase subunit B
VISAPIHVQDFPARHSPQMGFEGANVLFDTLVHPLMMGLEEHLLGMFREDPEFHDGAAPSHLGRGPSGTADAVGRAPKTPPLASAPVPPPIQIQGSDAVRTAPWAPDAEKELKKIPFFVRGKARANTERFARERQLPLITLETLYDAKAHFGR